MIRKYSCRLLYNELGTNQQQNIQQLITSTKTTSVALGYHTKSINNIKIASSIYIHHCMDNYLAVDSLCLVMADQILLLGPNLLRKK